MSVWTKIAFAGKTTGVWEAGTRTGRRHQTNGGHQINRWNFIGKDERKFGRGFYAALNRMPESEYKTVILKLVKIKLKSRGRGQGLTEKQWRYLGVLMTKADPACLSNPEIKIEKKKKKEVSDAGKYIGLRKKQSA